MNSNDLTPEPPNQGASPGGVSAEIDEWEQGRRFGLIQGDRRGFDRGYLHGYAEGARDAKAYRIGYKDGWQDGYLDGLGDRRYAGRAAA